MFTLGKLVKGQALLQLTHNCGSVGLLCWPGMAPNLQLLQLLTDTLGLQQIPDLVHFL